MSKSQSKQPRMVYFLGVVFALPPDSALHRAMESIMYTNLEDFIMEIDETIDDLIFRGEDKKNFKTPKAEADLLSSFMQFVAY